MRQAWALEAHEREGELQEGVKWESGQVPVGWS